MKVVSKTRTTQHSFEHMINIIKGFAKGKIVFKGVDQGITNVVKDEECEMPKIQTFTPTLQMKMG